MDNELPDSAEAMEAKATAHALPIGWVALLVGLAAAVVAAFLADHLDNTVKSQEQIEQVIGLPFLGIVPGITGDKGARLEDVERDKFVLSHPRSSVAECCRTIRTNLLFASHERPARRILVTSSGPQEGKSTTAVTLAITLAQSGARTLLCDTDLRRPRLHRTFGIEDGAGISSLILGETGLTGAVRPSGIERLDVLPCGPVPPNPAELLHAASFQQLVDELARSYDRIVFDSPPAAAVTDALVLARLVDGVVIVMQAGRTPWPSALETRRRLASVGAVLFGAVLNGVDLDAGHGAYFRYYQYYRTEYGEGTTKAAG